MNKREKEVLRYTLEQEKAVIEELKAVYSKALDDIGEKIRALMADELTQSKIYQIEYQKALKGQVSAGLDNLNSEQYDSISGYLKGCYEDGFIGALYNLQGFGIPLIIPIDQEQVVDALMLDSKISEGLYTKLGNNVGELKKAISQEISRGISTAMPYADIARNLRSRGNMTINQSMNIVQTEGHRIQSRSALDAGEKAKAKGADLVKVWDSTLDSKTRPHHRALDGQVRELDEDFEVDGLTADSPGHFGTPSEDCRCRCAVLIKPRWDVDGSFTKRNNETGELLEFENVKSYEEFKKRYWETVDKPGGSGIIKSGEVKNMSINAIELPIEQQHTGKGNPNAILMFGTDLNNRQKKLLNLLPEFDSRITVLKKSVNMADLSALTAQTGHEFAMFTKGNERLIIRGNSYSVNITVEDAKKLAENGYKWSGHTHPGTDYNCLIASSGDKAVLQCFNHKTSVIYDSKGNYATFEKEE
ncbi:MAG: phage minor head protein [Porcipelethomonas sp.]